jgi:hypothetical protein
LGLFLGFRFTAKFSPLVHFLEPSINIGCRYVTGERVCEILSGISLSDVSSDS